MNPIFKNPTKGRVLYADHQILYKAITNKLCKSIDQGESWSVVYKIKGNALLDKLAYINNLACRLLRKGIHHLSIDSSHNIGLLYNKNVAVLNENKLTNVFAIKGSRPLSLEYIESEFIFGEYRSNPERSAIGLYGFNLKKDLYRKLEMKGIRHIHGIYQDPYTDKIWITTGDNDDEAALYCTDTTFNQLEKILYGSQQTRTIKLLFTEDSIYFGSDAPDEVNYLYRLNKKNYKIKKLIEVGSSVFHGSKIDNWLFFSTAVEPSQVNTTKYVELWASPNGMDWKCILKLKKDRLSLKYFQYGQIFLSNGPGNDEDLWIAPFATKYSNQSLKIKIKDLESYF